MSRFPRSIDFIDYSQPKSVAEAEAWLKEEERHRAKLALQLSRSDQKLKEWNTWIQVLIKEEQEALEKPF